jgi:hypothetical protein
MGCLTRPGDFSLAWRSQQLQKWMSGDLTGLIHGKGPQLKTGGRSNMAVYPIPIKSECSQRESDP